MVLWYDSEWGQVGIAHDLTYFMYATALVQSLVVAWRMEPSIPLDLATAVFFPLKQSWNR